MHPDRRVMRRCGLLLGAVLLLGCTTGAAQANAAMCDVAGSLALARSLAREALAKEAGGDGAAAVSLAGQARAIAQEGHDRLQTIRANDTKRGATWQALLSAYLHVGQAANALGPGDMGGPEVAAEELTTADRDLETAGGALPASCFAVGPSSTSGTASPSGSG